ncbi:MAG: hypothetical protein D9V45_03970 [Chloroflexi bacterium]|nr:MAG: hypothetical protein D9V45_03970 [Chloroflexota bacterium]
MENTEDDIIAGLKVAVSEVSGYMADQRHSLTILRDTAKSFFTAASVVISLVISLNLFFVKVEPSWRVPYWILLALLILAYCGFTFFSIKGFLPTPITKPFPDDYDILTKNLCVPEIGRQAMILSSYLESMKFNRPIVIKKTNYVKWSAILWGVIIILVIFMAAIPKV